MFCGTVSMSEIIKAITPLVAVVSAVVAGYITFRNQIRLKALELLLERRQELLKTVEERIELYRNVLAELAETTDSKQNIKLFTGNEFHDSMMLYHRAKGIALGPVADSLIETYWAIGHESLGRSMGKDEAVAMLQRKINTLSAFYGFAHIRISSEIEKMTLSRFERLKRLIGIKETLKVASVPKSKRSKQETSVDTASR